MLEKVHDGHLGSAGASVQWSLGQCWSKCTMVTWAVLEQVYDGHLGSAGASVQWSPGQCRRDTRPLFQFSFGQLKRW